MPYNSRGGEWGTAAYWIDDFTPPQITCANSGEVNDFQWPLNEVKVDLAKTSVPGAPCMIEAKFSTFTPNFQRYDLTVDGRNVPIDGGVYVWRLNKGTNSLRVVSVNAVGRAGFPSEFVIEYDPAAADRSRQVAVTLKNPGFEEALPSKGEASSGTVIKGAAETKPLLLPAGWGTICSNAFQCAEFVLDGKVRHSGKTSLRTAPAKTRKPGSITRSS